MTDVHSAALRGFSEEAEKYARGRPDYPDEILDWLRTTLELSAGKTAVDLGAGTGKFTRLLVQTGAGIVAVEPVGAMREQLIRALPGVQAVAGTAQDMPLGSASADALTCAQSFHWFATEEALEEIHRVLKPGGKLGLVWNVRDETVDWVAAITEIITPHEGDAPRFYKGDWRRPFAGELFTDLEETSFAYQHVGSAQEVIVDRFLSVSFIAALPAETKADVAAQLNALIASHPALRGRHPIRFPYRTRAYRCISKPRPGAST